MNEEQLKNIEGEINSKFRSVVDWSSAHPQFMMGLAAGFLLGAVFSYLLFA